MPFIWVVSYIALAVNWIWWPVYGSLGRVWPVNSIQKIKLVMMTNHRCHGVKSTTVYIQRNLPSILDAALKNTMPSLMELTLRYALSSASVSKMESWHYIYTRVAYHTVLHAVLFSNIIRNCSFTFRGGCLRASSLVTFNALSRWLEVFRFISKESALL